MDFPSSSSNGSSQQKRLPFKKRVVRVSNKDDNVEEEAPMDIPPPPAKLRRLVASCWLGEGHTRDVSGNQAADWKEITKSEPSSGPFYYEEFYAKRAALAASIKAKGSKKRASTERYHHPCMNAGGTTEFVAHQHRPLPRRAVRNSHPKPPPPSSLSNFVEASTSLQALENDCNMVVGSPLGFTSAAVASTNKTEEATGGSAATPGPHTAYAPEDDLFEEIKRATIAPAEDFALDAFDPELMIAHEAKVAASMTPTSIPSVTPSPTPLAQFHPASTPGGVEIHHDPFSSDNPMIHQRQTTSNDDILLEEARRDGLWDHQDAWEQNLPIPPPPQDIQFWPSSFLVAEPPADRPPLGPQTSIPREINIVRRRRRQLFGFQKR